MLKREDLPQFQMRESTLRKVNHWEKRLAALLKCNPVPLELCFDLLRDKVSILDEDLIETLQEGEKNFNKQIEEFKKDLAITKAQLNAEISLAIEGLVKAQKAASLKKQSNELNTVAKDLSTQHKNDLNILNGKLTIQLEEHKQILDQHNSDIRDLKQETSVKSQEIFVLREQIKNSMQIEILQEVKEKAQDISMLKDKIEEQNKIIEELKVQSESKDKQISAMEIEILGKVQ